MRSFAVIVVKASLAVNGGPLVVAPVDVPPSTSVGVACTPVKASIENDPEWFPSAPAGFTVTEFDPVDGANPNAMNVRHVSPDGTDPRMTV
jgi:hypothetical protein